MQTAFFFVNRAVDSVLIRWWHIEASTPFDYLIACKRKSRDSVMLKAWTKYGHVPNDKKSM